MAQLNSEQNLAVDHQGGVLLKAGAGSGKTTVLIAHIVHLTQQWMEEFGTATNGFEEFIRTKFSQVVMMTFTKKAAGEMSVRLNTRIEALSKENGVNQEKWKICLGALPVLSVTTIDSFNRRLITAGYFPELSTEVSMIFEAERFEQVSTLFDGWFAIFGPAIQGDLREIIDRDKGSLLKALRGIFNDSGARLLWKEYDLTQSSPDHLGKILHQSFTLNELSAALLAIHGLDIPTTKPSSFETTVQNFQNTGLPEVDSVEKLKIYVDLFAGISSLRGQSAKTSTPAHEAAFESLKVLRTWSRDTWLPVIEDYVKHYEGKIVPWLKLCKSLFDFIDERLDPNQGMTFGDVEFFVARALQNRDSRERINRQFTYFIVDEFQDTSAIQFRIIRQLIGGDFKRLFCVGDPKQAIYGFRGGEISVFQDCEKLVPKVLTLANNYRSLPNVIKFNNSIFRAVLPVGREYLGEDPFPVLAEDQNIPLDVKYETDGSINVEKLTITRPSESKTKLKNPEIEALEAEQILLAIERIRSHSPNETCTVLYRSVKRASVMLLRLLMDRKIGFTAQYKVNIVDDPLMGIFIVLLKRQFDRNPRSKSEFPLLMIGNYLSILQLNAQVTVEDLEIFDRDISYWGLLEAFKKFVFRLGISNENFDLNYEEIESLGHLFNENPEAILDQLHGNEDNVNLEFRSGTNTHLVQIMTAHASKGLEFDHVFLAGVFSNGYEPPERDIFGDRPDSFKWHLDLSQKESRKSPMFVFESELKKLKNFSESKRLFYVACTRAKKSLGWVDLENGPSFMEKFLKISWTNAFSYWENHNEGALHANLVKSTDHGEVEIETLKAAGLTEPLPLFFYDSVGIIDKTGGPSELLIAAELSVTRLNSLIDCPRKFHLENILKLKAADEVRARPLYISDEREESVLSASERGSKIHEYISRGISENFVVHRDVFETQMRGPIEWALGELRGISSDHQLISEKPVKFRFFNFMISGIPDLIAVSTCPEQNTQIWDFKTGRITQENLSHYWVQLKSYAYALYELGRVPREHDITLRLCFVDQEKFIDLSVNYSSIVPELFQLWRTQNEPWKTNLEHCGQCVYGTICHR